MVLSADASSVNSGNIGGFHIPNIGVIVCLDLRSV